MGLGERCMTDTETGFCMRCKASVVITEPVRSTMANGRKRVSGLCSKLGCEGRISKIVG